jgi:hypothetical protein
MRQVDHVLQAMPDYGPTQASLAGVLVWLWAAVYLLTCALLLLFVPPLPVLAQGVLVLGLYLCWRWPAAVVAAILVLAPFQPLPTMVLKAAGLDWAVAASSLKELGLLAAVAVLAWRVRPKLGALDFILLMLFGWAIFVSAFRFNSDTLISLKDDFDFLLAFYAGRLIVLERSWVHVGLWTAGVVASLGAIEFFIVGPGPRMLLMGVTNPWELGSSFQADSFSGTRAASTLASPLEFGAFCALGLLVFAAFRRQLGKRYLLPALMLGLGLLVSLTRMAWMGAGLGLILIAYRQGRLMRLAVIGLVAVPLFMATLVPYLDLNDYVKRTIARTDVSEQGHVLSLVEKSAYVLTHPLGDGAGSVGPRAAARNSKALEVESAYLMFGIAYGWPGLVLFSGFYSAVVLILLRKHSILGSAAAAVAVAMSFMLAFSPLHIEFPLNSWAWVLIGSAIAEPASRWGWRFTKAELAGDIVAP